LYNDRNVVQLLTRNVWTCVTNHNFFSLNRSVPYDAQFSLKI